MNSFLHLIRLATDIYFSWQPWLGAMRAASQLQHPRTGGRLRIWSRWRSQTFFFHPLNPIFKSKGPLPCRCRTLHSGKTARWWHYLLDTRCFQCRTWKGKEKTDEPHKKVSKESKRKTTLYLDTASMKGITNGVRQIVRKIKLFCLLVIILWFCPHVL